MIHLQSQFLLSFLSSIFYVLSNIYNPSLSDPPNCDAANCFKMVYKKSRPRVLECSASFLAVIEQCFFFPIRSGLVYKERSLSSDCLKYNPYNVVWVLQCVSWSERVSFASGAPFKNILSVITFRCGMWCAVWPHPNLRPVRHIYSFLASTCICNFSWRLASVRLFIVHMARSFPAHVNSFPSPTSSTVL